MELTGIDIINLANEAKEISDESKEAESTKCTCTGFVLQYQGCSCEKGKKLKKIKERTKKFFGDING